jgi:[acyl-carrier-protein] S-malonyltransferase
VERACAGCKARGAKRALLLPVSAPFHSSLIRPAADKLAARLAELELCCAADPGDQQRRCGHRVGPGPDQGRAGSAGVLAGALGRDDPKMAAMDITTVAECGPGKVLAGLTKRCADLP